MTLTKQEMIDKLKLEAGIIRDGGYNPSVREPRKQPRIFRDSVTCLNVGLEVNREPCSNCLLMQFVPPEQRDCENPCHHIPLNERGDTVASLEASRDRDRLEQVLLAWLEGAIARAEKEAE